MRRVNPDAIERGAKPRAGRKAPGGRTGAPAPRPVARQPRAAGPRRAGGASPGAAAAVAAIALLLAGGAGWLWRAGMPASIYGQVTGAPADGERRCGLSPAPGHRRRTPEHAARGAARQPRRPHAASRCSPSIPVDMKTRLESAGLGRAAPRSSAGCPTRSTSASPRTSRSRSGSTSGSFRLIDRDGQLIGDADIAPLRQAAGAGRRRGAAAHAPICSTCWRASPTSRRRVRGAVWVGERRWNLHLDNGIDVKLPADSPQAAWSLLARLEREQQPAGPRRQRHRPAPARPSGGPAWPGGRAAAAQPGNEHLSGKANGIMREEQDSTHRRRI